MIIKRDIYTFENVELSKKALQGIFLVAFLLGAYLVTTAGLTARDYFGSKKQLHQRRAVLSNLSRESSDLKKMAGQEQGLQEDGVHALAAQLSTWAAENRIKINSLVPDVAEAPQEVEIDGVKLGSWRLGHVLVKGTGDFLDVIEFCQKFRRPHMPVRIDTMKFQSAGSEKAGGVGFELELVIYERSG